MLPMQRITRLPLLVDAILSQMDSEENSLEYQMCELTLASLNTVSAVQCDDFFTVNILDFVFRLYKIATKALGNWNVTKKCCYSVNS